MKELILLTDSGHGGMIRTSEGSIVYSTGAKKRYKFESGEEAFEGLVNRAVEKYIIELWEADKRPFVDVSSGSLDIPLELRTTYANQLNRFYSKDYSLFYLSLHSNAGKGTGIEVISSVGNTKSDPCATIIYEELEKEFPEIVFRKDKTDGDPDKEQPLWVLDKTDMPSVLIEFLFFDNLDDWKKLNSEAYQRRYAKAIYAALLKIETKLGTI